MSLVVVRWDSTAINKYPIVGELTGHKYFHDPKTTASFIIHFLHACCFKAASQRRVFSAPVNSITGIMSVLKKTVGMRCIQKSYTVKHKSVTISRRNWTCRHELFCSSYFHSAEWRKRRKRTSVIRDMFTKADQIITWRLLYKSKNMHSSWSKSLRKSVLFSLKFCVFRFNLSGYSWILDIFSLNISFKWFH